MCEFSSETQGLPGWNDVGQIRSLSLDHLVEQARRVVAEPEVRRTGAGFIGYGSTKKGDRVLVGVDTHYDMEVINAFSDRVVRAQKRAVLAAVTSGIGRRRVNIEHVQTVARAERHIGPPILNGIPGTDAEGRCAVFLIPQMPAVGPLDQVLAGGGLPEYRRRSHSLANDG